MKNGFIKQQTSLKKGLTLYVCLRQSQMGESEKTWSFQPCMAILTGKKMIKRGIGKMLFDYHMIQYMDFNRISPIDMEC